MGLLIVEYRLLGIDRTKGSDVGSYRMKTNSYSLEDIVLPCSFCIIQDLVFLVTLILYLNRFLRANVKFESRNSLFWPLKKI
jgi:hypothetical protein